MHNLLPVLGLLALLALLVGLIQPSAMRMPSRKQVGAVFGTTFIVLYILFEVTSPRPPKIEAATTTWVFNVPSLIGKSVDEISQSLGTAKDDSEPTELQLQNGVDQWDKTWEKGDVDLVVTYNPITRAVIDLFVSDTPGITANTSHLLAVGDLNENDPEYDIEFVRSLKDDGYTGVKITAKVDLNRTY